VGNQRADGIVKAISGKAVAGGLKGKGKAEVEEDMEAKVRVKLPFLIPLQKRE
jgi:hypothetical protein